MAKPVGYRTVGGDQVIIYDDGSEYNESKGTWIKQPTGTISPEQNDQFGEGSGLSNPQFNEAYENQQTGVMEKEAGEAAARYASAANEQITEMGVQGRADLMGSLNAMGLGNSLMGTMEPGVKRPVFNKSVSTWDKQKPLPVRTSGLGSEHARRFDQSVLSATAENQDMLNQSLNNIQQWGLQARASAQNRSQTRRAYNRQQLGQTGSPLMPLLGTAARIYGMGW